MSKFNKIIDVSRSFMPMDPNAFPENLVGTQREDSPEQPLPILAFEGQNFLPTLYGYRSFFGLTSKLDIAALDPSVYGRVDKLYVFHFKQQVSGYSSDIPYTLMLALTEKGVYLCNPKVSGAGWSLLSGITSWTHDTSKRNIWFTYLLGNKFCINMVGTGYGYPSSYITLRTTNAYPNQAPLSSTGIGVSGMLGAFRAGNRRGYWDATGTVYWSDLAGTDFTPSLTTGAGYAVFTGTAGDIINVVPMHTGFIIYCTKSIVGVRLASSGASVWDAEAVTGETGIADVHHVCMGLDSKEHYAWTSQGFIKVSNYQDLRSSHKVEQVFPELTEYLKERRATIALECLNARYLFIQVADADVLNGYQSSYSDEFPAAPAALPSVFNMQELASENWFPTFKGAFVYDLRLQKWGKFVGDYIKLLDYQGVTQAMPDNIVTDNLGVDGAVLKADGHIYSFSAQADVSWLRWGKIGVYREGFTVAQEVHLHFRTPSKGSLTIDSSTDGRDFNVELTREFTYEYCRHFVAKFSSSGRWHTIKVSGQFDIQLMEFRGNISGRR